ncbi:UxaA family hydrolase [uncultured Parasutterella sp.]|uniref:UxaA family hydrolase n=1 Tax=uncultured Parasutterella sp. TaxID=1263098 RepID=UPI0025955C27|nr:UxaA family hydrolase [uncultured Parasutterella sp.]
MPKALHIHPNDNVAVCTSEVKPADEVEIIDSDGSRSSITAVGAVAFCNKIALRDIEPEEDILKYGEVIGKATQKILKGTMVSHLNIRSCPRSYADEYIQKGE